MPASDGQPLEVMPPLISEYRMSVRWGGDWIWYWAPAGGIPGIWRVPVDEARGTATAPPELVFRQTSGTYGFSVSADGKRVVFASVHGGISGVVRHELDALHGRISAEAQTILAATRVHYLQGASPDGEWLATWIEETLDGQRDIVLVRTATGETKRLTNDAIFEDELAWAPDGSKIYFDANPAGKYEVWSIHPDGSGRERVANSSSGALTAPLPSPDGRELLLWLQTPAKANHPCKVDLTVPIAQRRLTPLPPVGETRIFFYYAWSPDGRWIVGVPISADAPWKQDPVVVVFDVAEKTYRKLADLKSVAGAAWLPDSRRIVIWTDAPTPGKREISVLDRETGAIRSLGSVKYHSFNPNVTVLSRDGRSLFVNESLTETESNIWMLDYREEK